MERHDEMLKGALEKRTILDQGASHFKMDIAKTKLLKDKWELIKIFIDIFKPFVVASLYVN